MFRNRSNNAQASRCRSTIPFVLVVTSSQRERRRRRCRPASLSVDAALRLSPRSFPEEHGRSFGKGFLIGLDRELPRSCRSVCVCVLAMASFISRFQKTSALCFGSVRLRFGGALLRFERLSAEKKMRRTTSKSSSKNFKVARRTKCNSSRHGIETKNANNPSAIRRAQSLFRLIHNVVYRIQSFFLLVLRAFLRSFFSFCLSISQARVPPFRFWRSP